MPWTAWLCTVLAGASSSKSSSVLDYSSVVLKICPAIPTKYNKHEVPTRVPSMCKATTSYTCAPAIWKNRSVQITVPGERRFSTIPQGTGGMQ